MNIRTTWEHTPEGRIAAVVRIAMFKFVNTTHHLPDYSDFRAVLRKPLEHELRIARLEEARLCGNEARILRLLEELADDEREEKRGDV